MGNHVHLVLVVSDPEKTVKFIQYVKRETSHAINRLMGRRQRTVWKSGFDSPIILDFEKAIERIVYFYTNPQRARLENKIEDYPNFSTWELFQNMGGKLATYHIPRNKIPKLPKATLSLESQEKLANELKESSVGKHWLVVKPFAWLECFKDAESFSNEEVLQMITSKVRQEEEELSLKGKIVGAHQLRLERIDRPHVPKKYGKKMICLSSSKELRIQFIEWFYTQKKYARQAFEDWRSKGINLRPPPGFFSPGGFLNANLLPTVFAGIF
jgi:hypothetical protein